MKKVILIIAALVMVFSGVAAVSAYEAHIVNVKAHVENALTVSGPGIDQGGEWFSGNTVFPQEWLTCTVNISLSDSFQNQSRVDCVEFKLWAENKTDEQPPCFWLGDAMYYITPWEADWDATTAGATLIGGNVTTVLMGPILTDDICLTDESILIGVGLDVPVFAGYYNAETDPKPKPSGLNGPTLIIQTDDPRYEPLDGFDGGIDVKIQVTDIYLD